MGIGGGCQRGVAENVSSVLFLVERPNLLKLCARNRRFQGWDGGQGARLWCCGSGAVALALVLWLGSRT